ncbi:glucose-dependent insulinotropic receptor [Guaruba guarouba]
MTAVPRGQWCSLGTCRKRLPWLWQGPHELCEQWGWVLGHLSACSLMPAPSLLRSWVRGRGAATTPCAIVAASCPGAHCSPPAPGLSGNVAGGRDLCGHSRCWECSGPSAGSGSAELRSQPRDAIGCWSAARARSCLRKPAVRDALELCWGRTVLGLCPAGIAMAGSALGAVLAVLASLIITANTLMVIALLCLIQKSGSKGLYFVLNLAVADAMVGFTVTGLVMDEFSQPFYPPQTFCVLRMSFVTSSSAASILSLTLIACDRHLAIRKPFHYFQLMTGLRVGVHLAGLWLVAAIIGFLPVLTPGFQKVAHNEKCSIFGVFHPTYMLTVFCVGFFPALFLFIYLYCDMLKIASVHVQHIQEVEQAGLAGTACPPARTTSDMKAMRTVAVLIGCFTLSWLPFFIASIVQTVCSECFPSRVIENYLWLLGLGNSLLNPLLYSFWQRDVRLQLSQLAAGVKRRILLQSGDGHRFSSRGTKSVPTVSCLQLQH